TRSRRAPPPRGVSWAAPAACEQGQRRDGDLTADGGDLIRHVREVHVRCQAELGVQRPEEIVVVGWDDRARLKRPDHPLPVALGEPATGDAGEEDVDRLVADRVVDQVAAALVIEARARDLNPDAVDVAALVGAWVE